MDQSSNTIDLNHIFQIYQIAVNKFKAHQCLMMEKLCKMSGDIYNFQQYKPYCNISESDIASSDSLMRTLDNYGLTIVNTTPNGNYFFEAIAISISQNPNLNNALDNETMSSNIEDLSNILRQYFVDEILGANKAVYSEFIPSGSSIEFETILT